jgi:hypothetical protein
MDIKLLKFSTLALDGDKDQLHVQAIFNPSILLLHPHSGHPTFIKLCPVTVLSLQKSGSYVYSKPLYKFRFLYFLEEDVKKLGPHILSMTKE